MVKMAGTVAALGVNVMVKLVVKVSGAVVALVPPEERRVVKGEEGGEGGASWAWTHGQRGVVKGGASRARLPGGRPG